MMEYVKFFESDPHKKYFGGIHKPCGQRRGEGGFLKKPCLSTRGEGVLEAGPRGQKFSYTAALLREFGVFI